MKAAMRLLPVWPYLFTIPAILTIAADVPTFCSLWVFVALTAVLCIAAFKPLCQHPRWNLIIKLAHVPFYLLLLIGAAILIAQSNWSVWILALLLGPPILVNALLFMVTSAVSCTKALSSAKNKGIVSPCFATVHTILHFMFILNVVSAICVYRKLHK